MLVLIHFFAALIVAHAATPVEELNLADGLADDDECGNEGGTTCGVSAVQRRTLLSKHADPVDEDKAEELDIGTLTMMVPPIRRDGQAEHATEATSETINQANWQSRVACVASPYATPDQLAAAVAWACGAMGKVFDCESVPDNCKSNPYRKADYIFGTYYRSFGSDEQDCKFGGTGILSDASGLQAEQKQCMVKSSNKHNVVNVQKFEMRACVSDRSAQASVVQSAISWACSQMVAGTCDNIPNTCKSDTFMTADYVLGTYYKRKAGHDKSFDCSFGGAGSWSSSSELAGHSTECVVKVKRSSRSDVEASETVRREHWRACRANRQAEGSSLQQAVQYACQHMPDFDCAYGPPPQCSGVFTRADFIFGTYVNSLENPTPKDCDFAGNAELAHFSKLTHKEQECIVHLEKKIAHVDPEAPRPSQTSQPAQHHSARPVGPVTRPPPQSPNNLPGLEEASVSHYARFSARDKAQLASGCMPGQFYEQLAKNGAEVKSDTPHLEGWFLAAAPIWMTQGMHGRNTASGQAGIGFQTEWFNYKTGKPNLPNGPADGMMFDGAPPADGYDTSDGCWEASWDDEHGQDHRVGMVVLDNCGHSDGIQNTVANIKWCVPFQFSEDNRGATCPMEYFDKCFPEKQASSWSERPYCHGDGEVVGNLKVTDNAPWAKMVIGTYTEAWCPDGKNCPTYTSRAAAAANNSILWSGQGSRQFKSEGPCENKLLQGQHMPELGSCSANTRDSDNRCRNAYGFPFHFDIATFENADGTHVEPPWGKRNTRMYGVRRVTCPSGIKKSMLGSCGIPDMFIGNNLVWGDAERSYVPPHWCKRSKPECLASPMYRQASAAYLAATGHAFCHSAQCQQIHASYR